VAGGLLGIGEKVSRGPAVAPPSRARESTDGCAEPGSRLGQPADHRAVVVVHPDEEAVHARETLEAHEADGYGHQRQEAKPEEESGPNAEVGEPRHRTARAAETRRMIRLVLDAPIAE
jgi:hypothetical protein